LPGISGHYAGMEDLCPSTSKNSHIYIKTLHEACLVLGGEHKLAAYLGVSVQRVEAWLNGRGVPPDPVFLRCVDLVAGGRP
jgi:DNA-binding transcriptional regulator YiaG